MVRVTFLTPDGRRIDTSEADGSCAMRAAVNANVPGILADCGGACSCATCHVQVAEAWQEKVGPAGELEMEMLAFEDNVGPASRLACQIGLHADLDGLELHVVRTD